MIWIIAVLIQIAVPTEHVGAYSRLDTVAGYVGSAAYCGTLGYTLTDDFTSVLAGRALAETKAAGVSEETATIWVREALQRVSKSRNAEMAAYGTSLDNEAEITTTVRAMYSSLQAKCAVVAADPISIGILTAGTPDELQAAKTAMEDSLLADVGTASWQTPTIWARGELLMGLGVCKNIQPRAEHERLLAEHLPPSFDTTSAGRWLAGQYVEGIRSSADMGLDAAQCRRLVSSRIAELNAAVR